MIGASLRGGFLTRGFVTGAGGTTGSGSGRGLGVFVHSLLHLSFLGSFSSFFINA